MNMWLLLKLEQLNLAPKDGHYFVVVSSYPKHQCNYHPIVNTAFSYQLLVYPKLMGHIIIAC